MADLNVDLWPTAAVLLLVGAAIIAMRVIELHADRRAALRTREALQRALGGPTEE